MGKKLTIEQLKERLKGFQTRSSARRADEGAYKAARRQGLLDELFPENRRIVKLTMEEIVERAKGCRSRKEFKSKHDHAYRLALKSGLIESLYPKKQKPIKPPKQSKPVKIRVRRRITREMVIDAASEFSKRSHFENSDATLYNYAAKHNLLDILFPMERMTAESFIRDLVLVHGDRYDYTHVKFSNLGSKIKIICAQHGAFWKRAGAHLKGKGCPICEGFDNNCFYIKLAESCFFNGEKVYKVGITSWRLGLDRLNRQSAASGMPHKIILPPTPLIGAATDIERFALSIGHNPKFSGFDGASEYRAYSDEQLGNILSMVDLCKANTIVPVEKKRALPKPKQPSVSAKLRGELIEKAKELFIVKGFSRVEVAKALGLKYGRVCAWLKDVVREKVVDQALEEFLIGKRLGNIASDVRYKDWLKT